MQDKILGLETVTTDDYWLRTLAHPGTVHGDKSMYKALPPLGKSEHESILLIPAYKQKLKQEAPVNKKKWSDEADAKLQDCFASTDWNMFRDSSDGIENYITSVTVFIKKCIEDVIPTVTVCSIPQRDTKGSTAASCPVTRAYQKSYITAMLPSRQITLKHA